MIAHIAEIVRIAHDLSFTDRLTPREHADLVDAALSIRDVWDEVRALPCYRIRKDGRICEHSPDGGPEALCGACELRYRRSRRGT